MNHRLQQLETLGIDVETTLKRFCGDADLLMAMLAVFIQEDALEQLPEAVRTKDYRTAESIAHTAKGTAANLGLAALSAQCDALVQAIRTNQLHDAESLTSTALASYRAVRAYIAAFS